MGQFGKNKNSLQHAGRECRAAQNGGKTRGGGQGRNVCRLKDGWLLQAPLAWKTPPGKAVRERKMPPRDMGYCKMGWHKKEIRRKQGIRVGGMDASRKK